MPSRLTTLDDAWQWYGAVRKSLQLFRRFAKRYWSEMNWQGLIGKDDHFRVLESHLIEGDCEFGLDHLDDLAVLILFSVFESIVRDQTLSMIREEQSRLKLNLLSRMIDGAVKDVEQGGFFKVLEVFRGHDANLIEEINQVRRYRNWVAHGRSNLVPKPDHVDPEMAYERLSRFLDVLSQLHNGSTHSGT